MWAHLIFFHLPSGRRKNVWRTLESDRGGSESQRATFCLCDLALLPQHRAPIVCLRGVMCTKTMVPLASSRASYSEVKDMWAHSTRNTPPRYAYISKVQKSKQPMVGFVSEEEAAAKPVPWPTQSLTPHNVSGPSTLLLVAKRPQWVLRGGGGRVNVKKMLFSIQSLFITWTLEKFPEWGQPTRRFLFQSHTSSQLPVCY